MSEPKSDMTVKCPHCDHVQAPNLWVTAHWHEKLVGTCGSCKNKFNLKSGKTWKCHPEATQK